MGYVLILVWLEVNTIGVDGPINIYYNALMTSIGKEEYKDKARFLLGESMGGVVALRVHRKQPSDWNGAILVAPMCKVSNLDYILLYCAPLTCPKFTKMLERQSKFLGLYLFLILQLNYAYRILF